MSIKRVFTLFALLFVLFVQGQTADEPVAWTTELIQENDSTAVLVFNAKILEKWHLYSTQYFEDGPLPTEFSYTIDSLQIALAGEMATSEPKISFDEIFEIDLPYFDQKAEFRQRIRLLSKEVSELRGEINYQACDDKVCIFRTEPFVFSFNGKAAAVTPFNISDKDKAQSALLQLDLKNKALLNDVSLNETDEASYWNLFFLGLLGGFLALLTPCVFPMIPLTVSYFLKQGSSGNKGLWNALIYGFFIVLIYFLLSLPFHFLDSLNPEILNTISTNVPLNLIFFGIFVFFAFSFFGYYELTLPSQWSAKADEQSATQGKIGIFFMALTLAIVSFSCTGPILGALLASSLTADGGATQLSIGMLGFGTALALPFALFALFPRALEALPKSGGWMTVLKVILGFLELALALKFLSNADLVSHWGLLKREVFIGIWVLLAFLMTLYLFGYIRFPHDSKTKPTKGRLVMAGISLLLTSYLLTGLVSEKNTLTLLSGFPPPEFYSLTAKDNNCPLGLDCYKDFTRGKAVAELQNKPILLDFTGWACVNCRKVEENVWAQPDVFQLLNEEVVLISLYVDDRKELPEAEQFNFQFPNGRIRRINTIGEKWATFQSLNFNTASQPYYVLMQPDGTLLNAPIQYTDASTYLKWLQEGLSN